MDIDPLVTSLESFPTMLRASVAGLADRQQRWKPESGAWSVLEIVCHVAAEEVDDFRPRVLGTLADPAAPWEPIDPEGVVSTREFNSQDLSEVLARFDSDRAESIKHLRLLDQPEWTNAYEHPTFGPICAGDVMVSWAAHDMLHLRQIAKRRFELLSQVCGGFSTEYAGQW
jgi:hypothetical protein